MLNRAARRAVCDSREDFKLLKPFCHTYRLKYSARYRPVNVYREPSQFLSVKLLVKYMLSSGVIAPEAPEASAVWIYILHCRCF